MKTDRRDARALCDAYRLGAFRAAHRWADEREVRRARSLGAVFEKGSSAETFRLIDAVFALATEDLPPAKAGT